MRAHEAFRGLSRYGLILAVIVALLLTTFVVVEALEVPLLTDPTPWMNGAGPTPAIVGVALLIMDVALPVPSSLVMITHGALFGLAGGALLTLVGSLGAGLFGFAVGRRGGRFLRRFTTAAERERADRLLARWGALAIIVTRPVPILAETTTIVAGSSRMAWREIAGAVVVGSIPQALLYSSAGALGASFGSIPLLIAGALGVAALTWIVGSRLGVAFFGNERHAEARADEASSPP